MNFDLAHTLRLAGISFSRAHGRNEMAFPRPGVDVREITFNRYGIEPIPVENVRVIGERITAPVFNIASNPRISLSDLHTRRFSIIDHVQNNALRDIQEEEDRNIFTALDSIGDFKKPIRLLPYKVDHYYVEPENEGRDECFFCEEVLVIINSYHVCKECDNG